LKIARTIAQPGKPQPKIKPPQRNQTGHQIHPLLQPELLDRNDPAADSGGHGADQSDVSPKPRRTRLLTFSHAYTQLGRYRNAGVATAFLASDYAKMITGDVM